MKVEKREIAQPKPPCEIVVTMTEDEARAFTYAINAYPRLNEIFRKWKDDGSTHAGFLNSLAQRIEDAL